MATAAPSKKAANRLVVEETATNDDNSVCTLHPDTMEKRSIFKGDIVMLKGKRSQLDGNAVMAYTSIAQFIYIKYRFSYSSSDGG